MQNLQMETLDTLLEIDIVLSCLSFASPELGQNPYFIYV